MFESAHEVCQVIRDGTKEWDHGLVTDMECANPRCTYFRNLAAHSLFCCKNCEDQLGTNEPITHIKQGKCQCTKYSAQYQNMQTFALAMESHYYSQAMSFLEDHPNI